MREESIKDTASRSAASLFTFGAIATAFGVASCCALPLLFASVGIGASWLVGIALIAVPYRGPLLLASAIALAAGSVALWRQQRLAGKCAPGTQCMSKPARLVTLVGLLLGAALLWMGYTYA